MTITYDPTAEASWGIAGSNITNVLEMGSTLPGTFFRIYTNNDPFRGHLLGSSNIGQTDNYFYLATQTSSNGGRIDLTVRNGNFGVGQLTPTAKLHVTGGNIWHTGSNAFLWGDIGKTVIDSNGMIDRAVVYTDLKTQWINDGTSNINYTRGRVAINTSNPEYELDVLGTIRTTDITMSSDARLKKDIRELDPAECRDLLGKLRPVRFGWNGAASNLKPSTGFIAQEILASVEGTPFEDYLLRRPEYSALNQDETMWTVNYMGLIAPMVQVIKTMQQRIDDLEKIVKRL